jgi:hypothetical protein
MVSEELACSPIIGTFFMNEDIQNLRGCEETEHALPRPSGKVQPSASVVTGPNSEETLSRLVMPSDICRIPDIRKTTAHNTSERRGSSQCGAAVLLTSSPHKNKLTEDLEKNAAKDKKKAGNDKMKGGVKQNQTRRGKQKATKEPIGKRKRTLTLLSSDFDDDFEEPILVESDEGSDDDTECPYCKEIFSTNAEKNGSPVSYVTSGVTKSARERMITRNLFARSA